MTKLYDVILNDRPDSSSTMVDHRIPGKPIIERVPMSKPHYG